MNFANPARRNSTAVTNLGSVVTYMFPDFVETYKLCYPRFHHNMITEQLLARVSRTASRDAANRIAYTHVLTYGCLRGLCVCRCAGHTYQSGIGPTNHALDGVYMGAIWQMRLNERCSAGILLSVQCPVAHCREVQSLSPRYATSTPHRRTHDDGIYRAKFSSRLA